MHEPATRGPQSKQSVHGVQKPYSPPGPPSSQSPSVAKMHVLTHVPEPGGPVDDGGGGGEWLCVGEGGHVVSALHNVAVDVQHL